MTIKGCIRAQGSHVVESTRVHNHTLASKETISNIYQTSMSQCNNFTCAKEVTKTRKNFNEFKLTLLILIIDICLSIFATEKRQNKQGKTQLTYK